MSVIYDTLDQLKSNRLEIKADAVNQHKINQKEMDFKVLSSNYLPLKHTFLSIAIKYNYIKI